MADVNVVEDESGLDCPFDICALALTRSHLKLSKQ